MKAPLVGGFWLIWLRGHNLSVAGAIGFIALSGPAAEFGVVMLVYLRHAIDKHAPATEAETRAAIDEGAVQRVRPKAMTVAVILGGLAPMIGGMITAPVLSMFVIPAAYYLIRRRAMVFSKKGNVTGMEAATAGEFVK